MRRNSGAGVAELGDSESLIMPPGLCPVLMAVGAASISSDEGVRVPPCALRLKPGRDRVQGGVRQNWDPGFKPGQPGGGGALPN